MIYPAASSTFLTLLVWGFHDHHGDFNYNPGDKDYDVADKIEQTLRYVQSRYQHGSPQQRELAIRLNAINYVKQYLDNFDGHNPVWWQYYPAPNQACGVATIGNATDAVAKRAGSVVAPAGNCTQSAQVASSRKRARRKLGFDVTEV